MLRLALRQDSIQFLDFQVQVKRNRIRIFLGDGHDNHLVRLQLAGAQKRKVRRHYYRLSAGLSRLLVPGTGIGIILGIITVVPAVGITTLISHGKTIVDILVHRFTENIFMGLQPALHLFKRRFGGDLFPYRHGQHLKDRKIPFCQVMIIHGGSLGIFSRLVLLHYQVGNSDSYAYT